MLLKDNEDLYGVPTRHGSAAVPEVPATRTSVFTRLLQGLGMNIIAKTTLPEFGLTASTESTLLGPTRNPWHIGHSAGGSSGGSAALVAAGVVPMAHSNDGGGSTRGPAACCGLVGLKPSRGRLPAPEAMAVLPVDMVTQGVLTRTVRDTALFFEAAALRYPAPGLPPIGSSGPTPRLRIGLYADGLQGLPVDPQVARAVRDAGTACETLGHHVEEVAFPFSDQFGKDFLRYWALLAFGLRRFGHREFGPDFDRSALEQFTQGLANMFAHQIERGPLSVRRLRRFPRDYARAFTGVDVLVSPVLASPPPQIGYLGPAVPFRDHMVRLMRYSTHAPMHNISGAPALSLPLSRTRNGLPIGVQFAAQVGHDRTLLQLARDLEASVGWPTATSAQ